MIKLIFSHIKFFYFYSLLFFFLVSHVYIHNAW